MKIKIQFPKNNEKIEEEIVYRDANLLLPKLEKLLQSNNVWYRKEKNCIVTRRSIVKIPGLSSETAYLVGVLTGDGSLSISDRKRGGKHTILRVYADTEEYLDSINETIQRLFGIRGRVLKDKRKQKTFFLRLENTAIFWYFASLGIPIGKKGEFSLPNWVSSDKNLALFYLRGLADTDGYLSWNRIQLKQKSKTLLNDVFSILLSLKMNPNPPKVNYTNGKPFYYVRFDNKLPKRLCSSAGRAAKS